MPLKVTRVAIGTPEGECSDGVAGRVEEDFLQAGVTVIDRQRFADVMSEHKLQTKTSFDQKTAARDRRTAGRRGLAVHQGAGLPCRRKNQKEIYSDKEGRKAYQYTVFGTIGGSMRVVDLTERQSAGCSAFRRKWRGAVQGRLPDPMSYGKAEKTAAFGIHKLLLLVEGVEARLCSTTTPSATSGRPAAC